MSPQLQKLSNSDIDCIDFLYVIRNSLISLKISDKFLVIPGQRQCSAPLPRWWQGTRCWGNRFFCSHSRGVLGNQRRPSRHSGGPTLNADQLGQNSHQGKFTRVKWTQKVGLERIFPISQSLSLQSRGWNKNKLRPALFRVLMIAIFAMKIFTPSQSRYNFAFNPSFKNPKMRRHSG